ncbi:MAG: nodulation protein NfeD, partial [bacterium]|nr:nodulation protein NfeD [bacterium]
MDPWAILFLLLVGGLLLLLVEFLLVPGFGLAGVVGLSAIVFSIGYAIFAAFIAQSIAVNTAMTFIFSSIIVSAGLVVMAIKYLPKTALGRRLILESSFKSEAGYVGSNENLEQMAGATGKTITLLRPAGMAEIKGYRV